MCSRQRRTVGGGGERQKEADSMKNKYVVTPSLGSLVCSTRAVVSQPADFMAHLYSAALALLEQDSQGRCICI